MTIFDSPLPTVMSSVVKPTYAHMNQAYHDYFIDSKPCKRGAKNQCAVRMSVAIGRSGGSLDGYTPASEVHRRFRACRLTMPHVMGSQHLANHLRTIWGAPLIFVGSTLATAEAALFKRRGVIFFRNCFVREGSTDQEGDHIDLWTGVKYFNDVIHAPAGGSAGAGARLFGLADQVWFFDLP
jgi:hypothetical protein